MKKILLSCLFLFALSINQGTVQAAAIPKKVHFDIPSATYTGGSEYSIRIASEDDAKPDTGLMYDIGVSRRLVTGRMVQFQILSLQTVSASDITTAGSLHNITLPNPLENSVSSTYVIYVKSYYPNNPESEQLVISQPFTMTSSSKPYAELVAGAVLLNTGRSHALNTGPTIYKEAKTVEYATSAQLALNISSNIAFTATPKFTFTKLRSNSFSQEIIGKPLDIAVGANAKRIDLPTFNYEPGVYKGQLELQSDVNTGLVQKINFQYIVGGPFVTVGQMQFAGRADDSYTFNMETFANPTDTLTPGLATTSTTTEIYKTIFTFMNSKGGVVATEERMIDYNADAYTLVSANRKLNKAVSVGIKVYDGTGKIFFETTQSLTVPVPVQNTENALYAISILLLGIAIYIMTRRKWVLVLAIVLAVASAALYVLADPWTPSPVSSNFNQYHRVTLTFDRDYSTEYLSCTEPTNVLVKLNIRSCDNGTDRVFMGTSRISHDDAKGHRQEISFQSDPSKTFEKEMVESGSTYNVYNYSLAFVQVDSFQAPIVANTKLYLYLRVETNVVVDCGGCDDFDKNAKYTITLKTTPATGVGSCDKCTNVVGSQDVPTFTARGRNYFYIGADEELYFAPSAQTLPGTCTLDMCSDTDTNETSIPLGFVWKNTGTEYEKRTCIPLTTEVCSCSGRNRVCVNAGVTTSNAPDASCNLSAICTYPLLGSAGSVTFMYSATNVIGDLIGGGPVTRTYSTDVATTIIDSRTLSNTGDSQTSTATCSFNYTPLGGGGDPLCPVGFIGPCFDPENPPVNPVINSLTASKIVDKGRDCVFTWETTDFDSCSLSGQLVGLDGTESFGTGEGRNITKTLACSLLGSTAYPSKTATCLVRPSVVEQ